MKKSFIGLLGCLVCFGLVFLFSCEEKFYSINSDFYKDKTVVVRNLIDDDTLRIERDNTTDIIMLEEANDTSIVFDNRAFVFNVEDTHVVTISEEGAITPVATGVSKVDIVSRTYANLSKSIFIKVYKDYHAVEALIVSPAVSGNSTVIEIGQEPYDLSNAIFVSPGNADNKKLHFSMENEASSSYATITDEGKITGWTETRGNGRAWVIVTSDDNPNAKARFGVRVLTEVLISEVTVQSGLDGITVGVGTIIDLNLCTGVLPDNVNVNNRKLTFEIVEGTDVVEVDEDGILTATGIGTAKLKATGKSGRYKEFTIVVKADVTDLVRLLWTVETSLGYAKDDSQGMPEGMFDDNATTYWCIAKPGKSYGGQSTPADHNPNFIVDMKFEQKFNYIRWNHRTGNSNDYLRVWGIDILGSNTGEFTDTDTIQTNIALTYDNAARKDYPVPESNYRYVMVKLTNWSDKSGGSTSGETMQVGEFGLGYRRNE